MPQFQSRVLDVTRTHTGQMRDARVAFGIMIYISILFFTCVHYMELRVLIQGAIFDPPIA